MKSILNKLDILNTGIEKIKKIPWILGSYAFSVILLFVLFDLILGEFLFYKYVVLIEKKEPTIVESFVKFEHNAYLKIMEGWQIKEQKFEESSIGEFSNPFLTKTNTTKSKGSIDLKR